LTPLLSNYWFIDNTQYQDLDPDQGQDNPGWRE
jgi:hypothetical protein